MREAFSHFLHPPPGVPVPLPYLLPFSCPLTAYLVARGQTRPLPLSYSGMAKTVDLVGPAPWGFRISGGRDFHTPIVVTKVRGLQGCT